MSHRSVNLATGEVLKDFPQHTDEQMCDALATADKAFRSWESRPISERIIQTTMSVAFIIISLVAASFAQEIKTDYDRKADFSHYKTFSFDKVETEDPLWVGRIRAAIGRELTAKGWSQVASGGDIAIIAIRITTDGQTLDHFYDTYDGGWGWRWGSGYSNAPATPETYTVGTLVIDLFDRKTKALLWRGSARRTLSDSSTNTIKNFDKSVGKLFKEFPSKT